MTSRSVIWQEDLFRALLENNSDGLWLRGGGGELLYASARMEALLGVAPGGLLGRSAAEFEREVQGRERRLRREDGGEVWVECAGEGGVGSGAGRIEWFRDISAERQAREAAREEQARLRAQSELLWQAMEVSEIGVWEFCPQTDELKVSPGYARMLGYEPEAFPGTGRAWLAMVHPDDAEGMRGHIRECLLGERETLSVEFRIRSASGGWVWGAGMSKAVQRDARGRPLRLLGTMRNIGQRRKEQELLLLLKAIVESSPDFIGVARLDGEVVYINRAGREMMGVAHDDDLSSVRYMDFLTPWERARMIREVTPALLERGSWLGECTMQTLRGETFSADAIRFLVRSPGTGEPLFFGGMLRDASARKRAEDELRGLNNRLEERVREEVMKNREKDHMLIQQSRLAAMGEMIGNIAHQWRQPINALSLIFANMGDAWDYGELTEEYLRAQLDKANRLIDRMSSTIDDFRNFFQPTKLCQPFNVYRSTEEALSLVRDAFQNHSIALSLGGDQGLEAAGFPNEYSQAILNLVMNARDAILERGVRGGFVSVTVRRVEEEAEIVVEDNGGGISSEALPRIFDPYFTTREKGTGIGLYMARTIIEKNMCGRLLGENGARGARFTVALPLSPREPS